MTDFNSMANYEEENNIKNTGSQEIQDVDLPLEEEIPMSELTPEKIAYFMDKLSGKDNNGLPNVGIGYQTYAFEDPEDSPSRQEIHTLSRAFARFTENIRIPGFAQIDIVFSGYADAELRMMWSKLEEYGRNCVKYPDKTWIFFINFLDSSSVLDGDYVLRACVISPVFWTLTREIPTMFAKDIPIQNDTDLQGGNVIRMLVPNSLLTFQYTESIDTNALKLERESLNYDNDYLSSDQNTWNEE